MIDASNYCNIKNSRATENSFRIDENIYILTDIFRKLYTELGCTWRQNNIMKQANYIEEEQTTQWSKEKKG